MTNCIQAAFSSGGGGGATTSKVSSALTSDFTTTSGTFTDVTGLTLTAPDITDGVIFFGATLSVSRSANGGMNFTLNDDGSRITSIFLTVEQPASGQYCGAFSYSGDADASSLQVSCKTGGSNTLTVYGSTSSYTSAINCIGVG